MAEQPSAYRAIWQSKPVLRAIYQDWYARMARACRPGDTLEIGGGSGNLKAFAPNVVTTDILEADWLDTVCDAQRLPFAEASFENIVMFDVLHHLERPVRFFAEAARVLGAGGRLVMLEPAVTPVSHVFYRHFHHEPIDMSDDPYADGPLDPARDPYHSNQAIPTLLFGDRARRTTFESRFPDFAVTAAEHLALFAYPLSGGFRRWRLIPAGAVRPLTALEGRIAPLLGRALAFRLLIVLEKN